ncbi:hypothetical protein XELAEV_18002843mg [Xenopus laevis]|nr:hypothetical protein XELAEV_18002843mg [Xenopus laevis]
MHNKGYPLGSKRNMFHSTIERIPLATIIHVNGLHVPNTQCTLLDKLPSSWSHQTACNLVPGAHGNKETEGSHTRGTGIQPIPRVLYHIPGSYTLAPQIRSQQSLSDYLKAPAGQEIAAIEICS